jgi:purine-binding chemotaxis protein CheW
MSVRRFCTFHVGDLLLGVEVELVQEVLGEEPMTRVPLADPWVSGLLNLRGQIVTAIDARRRLGLPPRSPGERTANIVLRTPDGSVSLVVDREGDVVDLPDTEIEPLPENVSPAIRAVVTGTCRVDERLLLMLDAERTLTIGSD